MARSVRTCTMALIWWRLAFCQFAQVHAPHVMSPFDVRESSSYGDAGSLILSMQFGTKGRCAIWAPPPPSPTDSTEVTWLGRPTSLWHILDKQHRRECWRRQDHWCWDLRWRHSVCRRCWYWRGRNSLVRWSPAVQVLRGWLGLPWWVAKPVRKKMDQSYLVPS